MPINFNNKPNEHDHDYNLGTNLTRLCSLGRLRKARRVTWKGTSVLASRYFFRMLTKAILTSIRDMCWPMQFLCPPENGIKASGFYNGWLNLSGLNSNGLSKYLRLVMQMPNPSLKGIFFSILNPSSSNGSITFLISENLTGPMSLIASLMKLFSVLLLCTFGSASKLYNTIFWYCGYSAKR